MLVPWDSSLKSEVSSVVQDMFRNNISIDFKMRNVYVFSNFNISEFKTYLTNGYLAKQQL